MPFKPIIVANWKMNKTVKESVDSVAKIKGSKSLQIIVAPSFVSLKSVNTKLKGRNIALAAQNIYPLDGGDFTGEVSPVMLKDVGCEYIIIGHSERRQHFGEDEDFINNKVLVGLSYGFKIILCVGETHDAMRKGINEDYVAIQLSQNLYKVKNFKNVIVAYEPVWAVNSQKTANLEHISNMHKFIKEYLYENFRTEVPILYGGSVDEKNCQDIINKKNVSGLLIGDAALNATKLNTIIRLSEKTVKQSKLAQ